MGVSVYAESNDNIIQAEGNDNIDIIEPDIDGVRQMRQHGNDNGDANDDDTAIQYWYVKCARNTVGNNNGS